MYFIFKTELSDVKVCIHFLRQPVYLGFLRLAGMLSLNQKNTCNDKYKQHVKIVDGLKME